MPTLIFKGIKQEELQVLAKPMVDKLSEVIQCRKEILTMQWQPAVFFDAEGQIVSKPYVEVHWFVRPQEMQDQTAKTIVEMVKTLGYEKVKVNFTIMDRSGYYDL